MNKDLSYIQIKSSIEEYSCFFYYIKYLILYLSSFEELIPHLKFKYYYFYLPSHLSFIVYINKYNFRVYFLTQSKPLKELLLPFIRLKSIFFILLTTHF